MPPTVFDTRAAPVPAGLPRALCITIHDVAPSTWPACERLLAAIEAVAPLPVTHLVVPAYHRQGPPPGQGFERSIAARLARGDEVALHGYVHLDEAPRATCLRQRFLREVFTRREGEFAALDATEACRRIACGLDWLARRGWPVTGFVAPAWLLGAGAWEALHRFSFRYTSTARSLHLLRLGQTLRAPTLVYAARNGVGRLLSRRWNDALARAQRRAPLVRLSLHPADAGHPALLRHVQALLERVLSDRAAMTKTEFVHRWETAMLRPRRAT